MTSRLNTSRSTGAKISSTRLFMGLPARSPISERFQGTIYMTLGCSRSPVTVAVPRSSRSVLGAAFWPDPEAAGAARPADPRAACAPPVDGPDTAGGAGAVAGPFDVSARGSPASDCAVDWGGFAAGAAGAGATGAGAAAAGAVGVAGAGDVVAGAGGCCATAAPDAAQHS